MQLLMVDDMIGKVLRQVEASGIEENTLIIISSDNGEDWQPKDKADSQHQANYILKGARQTDL